jgi:hypothetical protein
VKRRAILLTIAFAVLATAGSARAQDSKDDKPDPREKVDTAIAEAVRLIEAKEYVKLLKGFVPPDELKKITEIVTLDEFAKKFGDGKAPRLLKALKATKGIEPTMSDDGSKATIKFKEPIDGKDKIEFIKIGKHWYIKG